MVGLRWEKADLHIHTMESKCYKDKSNTAEEWIDRVKEVGLDYVAVTDHNNYKSIDQLVELGKQREIAVFPGVEVTCDTSKIHVLCIFDSDKNGDYVHDFLGQIGIYGQAIGESQGCTSTQVFEVCKKAKEFGGVVIAAHIDDYSGLSELSAAAQNTILDKEKFREYIDAVQVIHSKLWESFFLDKDTEKVEQGLRNFYGREIELTLWDRWKKTYKKAKDAGIPMLAASDNPCEPRQPKHGLWGIGTRYTWLKVGDNPNLEGIRQALISADTRVVMDVDSEDIPEHDPDFWLQSVEINKSVVNPYVPISVNLNPQLNTIIGGRGSGKSTIVRLVTGAMESLDADEIQDIKEDQDQFYRRKDKKNVGILEKESQITITFTRAGSDYRLIASNILKMGEQERIIEKKNGDQWEKLDDNYLDLWKAQVFTQKQIFEIAKSPNALLRIIDADINYIESYKDKIDENFRLLLDIDRDIRTCQNRIDTESKVMAEKNDYEEQIENYKKSGIADIIDSKQVFETEQNCVSDTIARGRNIFVQLKQYINALPKMQIEKDRIKNAELSLLLTAYGHQVNELLTNLINDCVAGIKIADQLEKDIEFTDWKKNGASINEQLRKKREELQTKGIDPSKLDYLLTEKNTRQLELDEIIREKARKEKLILQKKEAEYAYLESLENLRKVRMEFIESVVGNTDDIQITLVPYGDEVYFTRHVAELLGNKKSISVDEDIQNIANKIDFDGKKIEKGIFQFRKDMVNIRENKRASLPLTGYFIRAVNAMSDEAFDELITFWPEDKLKVSYRINPSGKLIPLSAASAGQKTTAILTFALAYGTEPLILDQPEDDMDNKLVYDLVVQRLKATKKNRQVIVVTHNANIPVNADAEFVIAMDSESRYVKVKKTGTIDDTNIRQEICDVMEGTTYAFKKRAEKYHLRIIE